MAKEAVIFKNVTKIFGSGEGSQKAVDNVSFSINKGEQINLVRPIILTIKCNFQFF